MMRIAPGHYMVERWGGGGRTEKTIKEGKSFCLIKGDAFVRHVVEVELSSELQMRVEVGSGLFSLTIPLRGMAGSYTLLWNKEKEY